MIGENASDQAVTSSRADPADQIGQPCPESDGQPKFALVLPGGGARAAYQVGVLRGLGRMFPEQRFPLITGVSAGAINAAYLAAHPGDLREATEGLSKIWENIEFDDIFHVDLPSLTKNAVRWMSRLALGGSKLGPKVQGLLDTDPLRELLVRELQAHDGRIEGIGQNVENGRLQALALLTVNYGTGQTVVWIEGCGIEAWERPNRRGYVTRIGVDHVMASAALPLLFPAVPIDGAWFGDGGIRMSAPLSPALHLGADRLLAISTRYPRSRREADESSLSGYPPPAQIAGNLLNAIFLDVLDQDVQRLDRLNGLLRKLPPDEREGLKPVDMLVLRPTEDLGRMTAGFEPRLPPGFRFLTRSLGTRETKSPDFLSLLMFHPDYLCRLIELGDRDAESQAEAVAALLDR